MPPPREVSKETVDELVRAYRAGGTLLINLGKPYGYDYKTVRRVLVNAGVEIRQAGGPRLPPVARVADVLALQKRGLSIKQIAERFGTYPNKISDLLRDAGHEPMDGRRRRGKSNPLTKTGRTINKSGYATVTLEPHEYHLRGTRSGNTMLEHRLVMARKLGRPLFAYENVHHRNGDKCDNRLANLELWEKGQPCGQRTDEAPARKHCSTCTCC